jgi:DNA-binding response OmpR family regulator
VHVTPDGEQAIDFVVKAAQNTEAPCPHLVLLDLNLPKIDGLGVLRMIRASERFKDLPVVVVTSSDSAADRDAVSRLTADYFRKPVTYHEFLMIGPFLRQFLAKHRLLAKPQ